MSTQIGSMQQDEIVRQVLAAKVQLGSTEFLVFFSTAGVIQCIR